MVYTGSEARATIGTDTWGHPDGPYAQIHTYDVWGNRTHREGWGGIYGAGTNDYPSFTNNNRQTGLSYDLAGNYTAGGVMTYDATGQQVASSASLTNAYDGDRLRGKKTESSVATYYLRSSVLGGQVVCEINASGGWSRGYVYLVGQLLAIQSGGVNWVHQEPTTKGQRITDSSGNVTALLELDPFGGEIGSWASGARSTFNTQQQPHKYTSYERDGNSGDDAMMRRYGATASRFDQPDPHDGSYDFVNPQSLNRYAYVNNDPVNFVDPSGLLLQAIYGRFCVDTGDGRPLCSTEIVGWADIGGGFSGGGGFRDSGYGDGGGGGGGDGGGGDGGNTGPQNPVVPQNPAPPQATCGVNPITGRAGFTAAPRGVPGNLRPGVGGQGHFGAPRTRGRTHQGLDISGVSGQSDVYSNRAGTVTFAGVAGDAGNLVIVDHGRGVVTRYAHLDSFAPGLLQGNQVNEGANLGVLGQTGNARGQLAAEAHVHFGVQVNGRNVDPDAYLNSGCPP